MTLFHSPLKNSSVANNIKYYFTFLKTDEQLLHRKYRTVMNCVTHSGCLVTTTVYLLQRSLVASEFQIYSSLNNVKFSGDPNNDIKILYIIVVFINKRQYKKFKQYRKNMGQVDVRRVIVEKRVNKKFVTTNLSDRSGMRPAVFLFPQRTVWFFYNNSSKSRH